MAERPSTQSNDPASSELLVAAEWAVALIDRLLAGGQVKLSERGLDRLAAAKAAIARAKDASHAD